MQANEFQLETIGNFESDLLRFWMITVIGITLGWIVYRLMVDPGSRRPQFQHLGIVSRRVALPIALAIALGFGVVAHAQSFSPFHAMGPDATDVVLERRYPRRQERIALDRLESVEVQRTRGGRQLVVRTKDGQAFRSAATSTSRAHSLRESLLEWQREATNR